MVDEFHAFESLRAAQRTARLLHANGVQWLVYELRPLPLDRRGSSSLVFESDDTIRRVRNFPMNWRELSDEALMALSWAV